uniref:phage tail protein n=1 Tax=uncultured Flavonifractor sp. TaxID=1193534 RepID=UPI002609117C|nr:phage tail protein [uncultured Flavonifractor sp.]
MAIVYPEPIQTFRFLIRVGNDEQISAAFSRFSGIRMSVETIQNRAGDDSRGVKEYTPVFTSYEPVTLSKGVVGDNEFLDWILSASADVHSGPTGNNLLRTIDVITLNQHGDVGVTWTLQNAMPIGYELAPLDGSRSEVLTESVTFAITGVKRTAAPWNPPKRES